MSCLIELQIRLRVFHSGDPIIAYKTNEEDDSKESRISHQLKPKMSFRSVITTLSLHSPRKDESLFAL